MPWRTAARRLVRSPWIWGSAIARSCSQSSTRRLEPVRVTGIARWADGRPAAGASVSTAGIGEYSNLAYRSGGKTDADGRFSLELLRGARYTLSVGGGLAGDGRIEITADDLRFRDARPAPAVAVVRHPSSCASLGRLRSVCQ